ncbi:Uncharacterised protein [Mycobacteroides abscessus subsp. abscessus]|nr:Uncharacterised protein [Mycobacteroides abscessus subsp. abscessus]
MAHFISKIKLFDCSRRVSAADYRICILGFSKGFGYRFRSACKCIQFKHTHRAVPDDKLA